MNSTDALLLIGTAVAPLGASKVTAGTFYGANDWRNTALLVAALSGAYHLATGSSRAGAVALGSDSGALAMYLGRRYYEQQAALAAR